MLVLVFDLRLHFVILLTLTSYFLLNFFLALKSIPRQKLFRPIFHRMNDLIFKINTILTLTSPLVLNVFTNLFVEISFFSFWKIVSIFCENFSLSQKLLIIF